MRCVSGVCRYAGYSSWGELLGAEPGGRCRRCSVLRGLRSASPNSSTGREAITAIGSTAWMGRFTQGVAPELRGRMLRALTDFALSRADRAALSPGNLFEESRTHFVSGGYRGRHRGLWIAAGVVGVLAVVGLMGARTAAGRIRV